MARKSRYAVLKKLGELIDRADGLMLISHDDVRCAIWMDEALSFVRDSFGEEAWVDLLSALRPQFAFASQLEQHQEAIAGAAKFLIVLSARVERGEWKPPSPAQTDLVRLFDSLKLHPRIVQVARRLFADDHYPQAIFEAFKAVNNMVKDKSGLAKFDGKHLMAKAFDEKQPVVKVTQLRDISEKDEQEGFKFLFMGATLGIRNPKAHATTVQSDPFRTLEYLALASLLAKRVDEAEAVEP